MFLSCLGIIKDRLSITCANKQHSFSGNGRKIFNFNLIIFPLQGSLRKIHFSLTKSRPLTHEGGRGLRFGNHTTQNCHFFKVVRPSVLKQKKEIICCCSLSCSPNFISCYKPIKTNFATWLLFIKLTSFPSFPSFLNYRLIRNNNNKLDLYCLMKKVYRFTLTIPFLSSY